VRISEPSNNVSIMIETHRANYAFLLFVDIKDGESRNDNQN